MSILSVILAAISNTFVLPWSLALDQGPLFDHLARSRLACTRKQGKIARAPGNGRNSAHFMGKPRSAPAAPRLRGVSPVPHR
jgi:hypothetical protein